jgi:putative peptide zinc metalloprotease protein
MNPELKEAVRFFPVGDELFHVYDRSSGRHFKLGKQEAGWLRLMDGHTDEAALRKSIPLEYYDDFMGHVTRMGLIKGAAPPPAFDPFRIKVLRLYPDRLVERLAPFTKAYRLGLDIATIPLAIFNLLVLVVEWSAIIHKAAETRPGWAPIAFYLTAVLGAGVVHEMSHALVARSVGVRVPAMGFMVMFLHPAFYADVSGINLLANRRDRIAVLLAGVKANNAMAALALVVCLTFPSGGLGLYALLFAGLNLILVLINLIPFVEYDGYYVFQELLGEPRYATRALQGVLAGGGARRADYIAFTGLSLFFKFALLCLAINAVRGWFIGMWPSPIIDWIAILLMIAAYPLLMMRTIRGKAR